MWVFADLDSDGRPDRSVLGLVTKARSLASEVCAVALGPGARAAVTLLGEYGATAAYVSDDPLYAEYPGEPAAHALAELLREHEPTLVLFGPSYDARDVAGRLQAMLGSTLVANVDDVMACDRVRVTVALSVWPGRPGNLRGGVGGTKHVQVGLASPPAALVLTRAAAFGPVRTNGRAAVVEVETTIPERRRRTRRTARHADAHVGPRLADAEVVVAGGRGLERPENFRLLDELAAAIGEGAVGATRPVVDAGWAPFSRQIGQTGVAVKPTVYIAVGISGAAQHVVGITGATRVVAINKDRAAPIFQQADLGVLGDALRVVPALVERLQERRSTA